MSDVRRDALALTLYRKDFPMQSPGWLLGSLIVLVGLAIVAAVVHSFFPRDGQKEQSGSGGPGIVRAMLALVLVGGLVILAGASFTTAEDAQTKNLFIGGVIASASAAAAFYFASRGAQDARRDLLSAAFGGATVPLLVGMSMDSAQAAMGSSGLKLQQPDGAAPTANITSQSPTAGSVVPNGSTVTVKSV
jgi:hypothetical protein